MLGGAASGLLTGVVGRHRAVSAADVVGPLSFFLLPTPARAYDTRPGAPPDGTNPDTGSGDTKFVNNEVRRIDVSFPLGTGAATGVPTSSQAVLLAVTVANVGGTGGGNLRIWGDTSVEPATASMTWERAGTVTTNTVITAHVDGRVRIRLSGAADCTVDVVVDVLGYYDVP